MARLLVTGATGFIGSRLLPMLAGHDVLAVTRGDAGPDITGVTWHRADLSRADAWRALPDDVAQVVHLAAVLPGAPGADFSANAGMAQHLMARATHWQQLETVVVGSTIAVYGARPEVLREALPPQPDSPYAASKLAMEQVLANLPARAPILRFSSVYGAGQRMRSVVTVLLERALRGEALSVHGDGSRTQDFLHVADACAAIVLALRGDVTGAINVASGVPTSMRELARVCVQVTAGGASIQLGSDPETSASVAVAIERARRELGFEPRWTLQAGLEEQIQAMIARGPARG